jgi:hypothetical protein
MRMPVLVTLSLATMAASCGDALSETPLAPPAALMVELPCVQHEGVAHLVSDDAQLFHAHLTGDVTGTLGITYTGMRVTGLVEHREGAFVLERQSGEILFGDGLLGRRVPVGPPSERRTYRFGASAALKERLASADGVREPAHGRFRIEGSLAPEPAASSLRYWLTECAVIP